MKMFVDNIITSGNFITDEELTPYILEGLGSEYDLVVVQTTARNTVPSLEKVYSLLLAHESKLKQIHLQTS